MRSTVVDKPRSVKATDRARGVGVARQRSPFRPRPALGGVRISLAWMKQPAVLPRGPSGEYGPYPPDLIAVLRTATDAQRAEFSKALAYADRMEKTRQMREYAAFVDDRRKESVQGGLVRAAQRRAHAEYHRKEWFAMRDAAPPDDPLSKDTAAPVIAAECRRKGRCCPDSTVRNHLKGA